MATAIPPRIQFNLSDFTRRAYGSLAALDHQGVHHDGFESDDD